VGGWRGREDLENITAEQPSLDVFDFLCDLEHKRKLSAFQICVLVWLGTKAGLTDRVIDLAKKPSAQSGKYSAHIDRVSGLNPHEAEEWTLLMQIRITRHHVPCG